MDGSAPLHVQALDRDRVHKSIALKYERQRDFLLFGIPTTKVVAKECSDLGPMRIDVPVTLVTTTFSTDIPELHRPDRFFVSKSSAPSLISSAYG